MVTYDLQIKVDGLEGIQNKMKVVEAEIKDFTSVFHLIADDFRRTEKYKFEAEGAYDGAKKWEALSPKYAERKQKEVGHKKILEYSGKLKKSLTNKGDANHTLIIKPTKMEIGTRVKVKGWNLARLHHHGTRRLPERKIIELTDVMVKRWTDLMFRGIRQTLAGGLEKYKSYVHKGARV